MWRNVCVLSISSVRELAILGQVSTGTLAPCSPGAFWLVPVRIVHTFSERLRLYRDSRNRIGPLRGSVPTVSIPCMQMELWYGLLKMECLMHSHKSLVAPEWSEKETALWGPENNLFSVGWSPRALDSNHVGTKSPELGIRSPDCSPGFTPDQSYWFGQNRKALCLPLSLGNSSNELDFYCTLSQVWWSVILMLFLAIKTSPRRSWMMSRCKIRVVLHICHQKSTKGQYGKTQPLCSWAS